MGRSIIISAAVLVSVAAGPAFGDVTAIIVDPSSLSYEMAPTNYANSPSNYNNSSTNYANSSSNYGNASSNYDNSKSNYKNGKNGSRRILTEDNQYVGYYVTNDDGVTNFFGRDGQRFGYNPSGETSAVFYTKGNLWCGVIASYQNQLALGLSQKCYFLLLSQAD
ncbi:MAG: hypothetical protein GYB49_08980 [Alphaproteobacteria bacterium]|nr:hypothetical protein [Alphaproteobacteria bacterium]